MAAREHADQVTAFKGHVAGHEGTEQGPGLSVDLDDAVFFAARDEVVPSKTRPRLPAWQRMLFGFMYHNAVRTPDRFDLSADKFIEVSRQVEL